MKLITGLCAAFAALMLAFAFPVWAHGGDSGTSYGGAAGFYSGAQGTISSNSQGSATAGSQITGSGYSFQAAGALSGGQATVGGDIGVDHATINTSTTNYAVTGGFGATNQPGMSSDGSSILNGNQAFATTSNVADGTGAWGVGEIGAIGTIGSIGNIGGGNNVGCNGNSCGNHGWGDGSNGNGNGNNGNH